MKNTEALAWLEGQSEIRSLRAAVCDLNGVMRGKRIRRLPVVNRAGGLFGMVTSDDLLNLLAAELSMLAGVMVEQTITEGRLRK